MNEQLPKDQKVSDPLKIQRYELDSNDRGAWLGGDDQGPFVRYDDHATIVEYLRRELRKHAFHKGEGEFSHIEYCNYCSYSRDWIAQHDHGETCMLRNQS
jgi:hypothetical protein